MVDLTPLAALASLQTLSFRDAAVSDVDTLFGMSGLTFVDLRGNPGVPCLDIDQLIASGVATQADECTDTQRIELAGIGHEMAFDRTGNRVFISVPSLNRITEIDLGNGSIAQTFALPGQPRGIDLAGDNATLYAALNDTGSLAVLNTVTGTSENIDISSELDTLLGWDTVEVSADRVVVSGNPGGGGFAYIVEVRRDQANAATRVASNRIIRAAPVFAVSQDASSVYVGEGFSPNSVYKLDATQADLPIVAEDDHGAVSGSSSLALNPDGSRLYLRSGQALSTETMDQVGQYAAGRSVVSQDGTRLFVGDEESDSARVYDLASTGLLESRRWGCDIQELHALEEFGNGILVLGDDLVCFSQTVPYP